MSPGHAEGRGGDGAAAASLPAASAIVLAGGRSERFGRDKLVEPLGGRPLLDHAVRVVAGLTTDVVVLGRPRTNGAGAAGRDRIRFVVDREPFAGPLVALRAGLELVGEPLALVVAGDMPTLSPTVLALLLRTLAAAETVEAAALVHRGRRQPVPAVLRVGAATPAVAALVEGGERRLGALFDELRTRDLAEGEWRPLDPGEATLRDVDRPEDLPGRG